MIVDLLKLICVKIYSYQNKSNNFLKNKLFFNLKNLLGFN